VEAIVGLDGGARHTHRDAGNQRAGETDLDDV
jgi:hypothetical protein